MCELLVGLPAVGVGDWPLWLRIAIRTRRARPVCAACDTVAHGHGRRVVELVDLAVRKPSEHGVGWGVPQLRDVRHRSLADDGAGVDVAQGADHGSAPRSVC